MKSVSVCMSINALAMEVAADREVREIIAETTFETIPEMNWGRELDKVALELTKKKFLEMAAEEDLEKRHHLYQMIVVLASLI